ILENVIAHGVELLLVRVWKERFFLLGIGADLIKFLGVANFLFAKVNEALVRAKMSKREIIEYFLNHKDEFENLYQSHSSVFKSYLEARRDHKVAAFDGDQNQDLLDQVRFEYGLLHKREYLASAENMEDL
ncbi:8504_t:CDS:2, partial [Dentiscutata erythropus]